MEKQVLIKLQDIGKRYVIGSEEIFALRGVDLEIYKGEFVALMGPSGSGKSTLMNILGCLDTPTKGTYILNGTDVSNLNDNELAEIRNKEIGFVFQTFNLLPRSSSLENVALPLVYAGIAKEARTTRAIETLESVGLGNRMYHKPNELSGGQRQRVAVARALVNNPAIILADEPTGNLDTKSADGVFELLQSVCKEQGTAVLFVTHNPMLAGKCQKTIEVVDGQIR